ncbi:MAG: DUF58 domain-containing protein [Ilumatobacteraceae bacterium]
MPAASAGAVVVLGAVTIGSGRLFGLIELYVIGTGLILGVLAAAVHVRTRIVDLDIRRTFEPANPTAENDIFVTLTLVPTRRTPTCDLTDEVGGEGRVGLTLAPLPRHRPARVQYRVPTTRRGVLTLGPATIELSDPLGLLGRRRRIGSPTDVVVHPRWTSIALPDPRRCEGVLIDFIRRLLDRLTVDLEFRSLREYVAGDDLRRINWKASARHDILTLNEYVSRAPLVVHMLLDHDATTYSAAGFERAISVVASFVGSAATTGLESEPRVHVSIPGHLDAAIDAETRPDAMRCLAEIQPGTVTASPTRLNDPGEFRVNVIVCGIRDRFWLESADHLMGTGHATIVVHCEETNDPSIDHDRWFTLHCSDFSAFASEWSILSRQGSTP